MPKNAFEKLTDSARAKNGSGRLLRALIAENFSLPRGDLQLSIVEIELTASVYAWTGKAAKLFKRCGEGEQVFLPFLKDRSFPRTSLHAKVVHTYGLRF